VGVDKAAPRGLPLLMAYGPATLATRNRRALRLPDRFLYRLKLSVRNAAFIWSMIEKTSMGQRSWRVGHWEPLCWPRDDPEHRLKKRRGRWARWAWARMSDLVRNCRLVARLPGRYESPLLAIQMRAGSGREEDRTHGLLRARNQESSSGRLWEQTESGVLDAPRYDPLLLPCSWIQRVANTTLGRPHLLCPTDPLRQALLLDIGGHPTRRLADMQLLRSMRTLHSHDNDCRLSAWRVARKASVGSSVGLPEFNQLQAAYPRRRMAPDY